MNKSAVQENIAAHQRRNAKLVEHITDRGGNTQRDRNIDCFFHTHTEDDAIALSRLLKSRGFQELSITHADDQDEHPWTVQGFLRSSVEAFTAPDRVEEFVRISAQHNALFDGWGTLLDEVPQPPIADVCPLSPDLWPLIL